MRKIIAILLIVLCSISIVSCEKEHVHKEVKISAIEATCTEEGKTEGKKCSSCGKILVEQEAIPKIDHVYEGKSCKHCGTERSLTNEDIVKIKAKMKNAVNYLSYASSSYNLSSLYEYAEDARDEINAIKNIVDSRQTYILNSGETLNQRVNEVYETIEYYTWRYTSVNLAKDELHDVQMEVLSLQLLFAIIESSI